MQCSRTRQTPSFFCLGGKTYPHWDPLYMTILSWTGSKLLWVEVQLPRPSTVRTYKKKGILSILFILLKVGTYHYQVGWCFYALYLLTSISCTAARGLRQPLAATNFDGGSVHGRMFTVQAPHPPCPHENCENITTTTTTTKNKEKIGTNTQTKNINRQLSYHYQYRDNDQFVDNR